MSASLHDLVAPPPRPRFREELWERAAAGERRRRRVRRLVLLAACVCGLAATASAGVVAFQHLSASFDRTVSCPVPEMGGVNVIELSAGKTSVLLQLPSSFGQPKGLADAFRGHPAEVNLSWCKPAPAIPLTRGALPRLGQLDNTCWAGTTIVVRLHATAKGAQLAIRTGKKLRPFAYAEWTGTHVAVYGTSDCMPGP
jgi:hypothetical protein